MMMRKISLLAAGALMGAGIAVVTLRTDLMSATSAVAANAETYRSLNLFGDIFEKIRNDYVEKPDDAQLIETAINGMLSSLDPHSAYLSPKHFRDMQDFEFTIEDGRLYMLQTRGGKRTAQAKYARDQLQAEATRLMRRIEKIEGQVERAAAAVARAVKAANPKKKQPKVKPLKQPKAKKPKATRKRPTTAKRRR
jgi:carboxyl-terminal processing protease